MQQVCNEAQEILAACLNDGWLICPTNSAADKISHKLCNILQFVCAGGCFWRRIGKQNILTELRGGEYYNRLSIAQFSYGV